VVHTIEELPDGAKNPRILKVSLPVRRNRTTVPSLTSTPSSQASRQTPVQERLAKLLAKNSKTQPTTPRISLAGMTPEEVKAHKARQRAESRKRLANDRNKANNASRMREVRENTTNEQRAENASRMRSDRDSMTLEEHEEVSRNRRIRYANMPAAEREQLNQDRRNEYATMSAEEHAHLLTSRKDKRTAESPTTKSIRLHEQRVKKTPTVRPYSISLLLLRNYHLHRR